MERKNISSRLFVAFAILISIVVLVSAISPTRTALINPYENWIETKDLKNCTIIFTIDATYSDSEYDEDLVYNYDYYIMRFENGEFDSANNTFRVSNTTETYREFGTIASKKECQIVFDSGANNIKSFSALVTDNVIYSMGGSFSESKSIKGSGVYFPLIKEIFGFSDTESGWVKTVDTKNTNYYLGDHAKLREYVKYIVKIRNTTDNVGYTSTRVLTRFEFYEGSYLCITFNGYLPRLRDSEGKCSWFGGKNDTGIDVTLRKKFYEEHVGEYTPAEFTYEKFYKNKKARQDFDKLMNEKADFFSGNYKEAGWEGTALDCGPARLLDTENDYFCAMRWHDNVTEKYNSYGKIGHQHWWREQKVKVTNPATNISVIVAPVDWGPHVDTGRVIDLSYKAMEEINATTNTWVEMCLVDSDTPLGLVIN